MSRIRTATSIIIASAAAHACTPAYALDTPIDAWTTVDVLTLLAGQVVVGIGALWALLTALLRQHEKRIDERFVSAEKARQEATRHWEALFEEVSRGHDVTRDQIAKVERELLEYKALAAQTYVERGAWLEHIGATNHKLDTIRRLIGDLDGHE